MILLILLSLIPTWCMAAADSSLELSQIDYRTRIRKKLSIPGVGIRWSLSVEKRYVPLKEQPTNVQAKRLRPSEELK